MKQWFRPGGSLPGDLVVAGGALVVALGAMGAALATVWFPEGKADYVFVVALAAACWPASRLAPRLMLLGAACVVSWPWWFFDVPEFRILPLVVVAFRCALLGVSPLYVGTVGGIGVLATLVPTSIMALAVAMANDRGFNPAILAVLDSSRRIPTAIVFVAVVVVGYLLRAQRVSAAELRERNEQLIALRDADRERVAEQVRSAIARDMHDVVAHHISAMVIRAQAADRVADEDPSHLRGAVRAVSVEGSEALASMRRLVDVLRESEAGAGAHAHPPFAEAVERMAGRLRAGGIEMVVSADTGGSPEFVEAAILPIIQEALTNVMLHASATRATLDLAPAGDQLELTVRDNGRPQAPSTSSRGQGVRGMRERAGALGGTLTAGPDPDGGWRVHALLPRESVSATS